MIVDLLLLKQSDVREWLRDDENGLGDEYFIAGLGAGFWQQAEDFKITDLSQELQDKLFSARPTLGNAMEYATYAEHIDWNEFRTMLRSDPHYFSIYPVEGDDFEMNLNLPPFFNTIVAKEGCAATLEKEALEKSGVRNIPPDDYDAYMAIIRKKAANLRKSGLRAIAPLVKELKAKFSLEFVDSDHWFEKMTHIEMRGTYTDLAHSFKTRDGAYHALMKLYSVDFRNELCKRANDAMKNIVDQISSDALLKALES
jgi:hypothetical protein